MDQFAIQTRLAEATIETFHVSILPWTSWIDIEGFKKLILGSVDYCAASISPHPFDPMHEDPFEGVTWRDVLDLGIRGMGWRDESREHPYDRFPVQLKAQLTPELWDLSVQSAGLYVDFQTHATEIFVRWTLEGNPPAIVPGYTAPCGASGVDCYGLDDQGVWRWVGNQEAWEDPQCNGRVTCRPLDGKLRTYRIYLPLRRRVLAFEVGARESISTSAKRGEHPIAYYGTSIVHGAGVSRPGLTHAAQMGRRLKREVLNLGFCGRAFCEPAVAEALGRLDPILFIVDVVPNNCAVALAERLPRFLNILRAARPETPILLLGDRVFGDAAFVPERQRVYQEKNTSLEDVYAQAVASGMKDLHIHFADSWFGDDFEGTSDASHPNDLGAWRMAESLTPLVQHWITQ
jgi:hypothetical protein